MDTMWLTLGSVFFGFALGFVADVIRMEWRAKNERKSIASVLLVECFSQAAWCAKHGAIWNIYEHGGGAVELAHLRQSLPPVAPAFNSVVGKIGAFEPSTAARILVFHGSLNLIVASVEGYASERNDHSIQGKKVSDIAQKWRAACFNALLAIRALEPLADMPELPNDEDDLSNLKDSLERVSGHGDVV